MLQTLVRLTPILILLGSAAALGQGQPPPLPPPPVPPANPQTTAKISLGKVLFWEEQLSLTGTVACGTCHRPTAGGTDPRSVPGRTMHPGADGSFGTADDVLASAGVPAHGNDGHYQYSSRFGFRPQVGGRKSPSMINAAYSPLLFWDGRAGPTFSDPITSQVLIQNGGALENQALPPILDLSEMGHTGGTVAQIPARLDGVRPLALAAQIPAALDAWINARSYPELFAEVFGSTEITPARIALALASYQRSLFSNQTPFDAELGGTPSLTAAELRGRQLFNGNDCNGCHVGNLLSDNQFHYIGVRPTAEDPGRFAQTGNPADQGRFRTPSLRNVAQRAPYFHNGGFDTLEEVVDFYNRGGDFNAPNKDPRVRPRGLNQAQRNDLVAFLRRPLTDPRVTGELPPFDRPTLYTESDRVPAILGSGQAGSAGIPQLTALEPPLLGTTNFTVVIESGLAGAGARLVVSYSDPGLPASLPTGDFANLETTLDANGRASLQLALPDQPGVLGATLFGRIYVNDPGASNGLAVTPAFRIIVFGVSNIVDALFDNGFE